MFDFVLKMLDFAGNAACYYKAAAGTYSEK